MRKLTQEISQQRPLDAVLPDDIKTVYLPCRVIRKNHATPENVVQLRKELDELLLEYDLIVFDSNELLKLSNIDNVHRFFDGYHNRNKVIWIIGDAQGRALNYYRNFCNDYGYEPLNLLPFNMCQFLHQPMLLGRKLDFEIYNRNKKFNCFVYGMRSHRHILVADIYMNNLNEHGYITYGDPRVNESAHSGIFSEHPERVKSFYRDNASMFPLTIDENCHDFKNRCTWSYELFNCVEDSYLTVCTESFYSSYEDLSDSDLEKLYKREHMTDRQSLEGLFPGNSCVSEKCFRPFHTGTLGLFHTTPNTLDVLRSFYDIFDDIIDHSYDTIVNDELRHQAFMKEFKRLCDLPNSEWQKIYKETLDRRIQNFETRITTLDSILKNEHKYVHYAFSMDLLNKYIGR